MEPLVDPSVESHEAPTSPKREPVQIDRGWVVYEDLLVKRPQLARLQRS